MPSLLRFFSLLLIALAVGCDTAVEFRPDSLALVDQRIVPAHREQIAAVLTELFGEPDAPAVPDAAAGLLDAVLIEQAAGPVESHQAGVTQGLYRRHCARCHGISGDGYGPTALYQHPYPRDFRQGVFKFKSTERGAPPTDSDLHTVLHRGVPSTAMPSFRLLQPAEREALVHYTKYLAIRGQLEAELIAYVADELDFDPDTGEADPASNLTLQSPDDREMVDDILTAIVERWSNARSRVVWSDDSAPSAESLDEPVYVDAGRELFHDAKRANCVACHGKNGGGGVASEERDRWGKRRQEFDRQTESLVASLGTLSERLTATPADSRQQVEREIAALRKQIAARREASDRALPDIPARPRKLAGGVLRGGGSSVELFRTIREGIAGSPMPGVGDALTEREIWRLVAYVRSIVASPTPDPPQPEGIAAK